MFKPVAAGRGTVAPMNRQTIVSGILAACVAGAVGAQSQPVVDPGLSAFDWIAGDWCMEKGGRFVEEHWLPARGGMLISVGRTVQDGKVRGFELLRIELRDGVVTFVAQPDGAPPVPFRLTASGPDWARFENLAHDFPQVVEYRRVPTGLHARIAGPGESGRERSISFDYLPCGRGK